MRHEVPAIVDGVIRFQASDVHPKALERLRRALSFPNPEYVARVRMGRHAGATPEEITLVEEAADGTVRMPRGAVGLLRAALAAAGQTPRFDDRRVLHDPVSIACRFQLRDYQEQVVQTLVRNVQGCAVVPPGGGKTVIGAAAIGGLGQPALVLVHTRDLVAQWVGTLRDALGIEAGVIADGTAAPGRVTVATVQAVAALAPAGVRELALRFGTVILDEAHHAPATVFREVLSAFPARYRFGLTATPERADGLTPLLDLCIGPALFRASYEDLVAAGHLVVPRVQPVETGCAPEADTHAGLVAALARDDRRNALITRLVASEVAAGRTVLVLCGRIDHCERLAGMLRDAGCGAEALTSRVSRQRRTGILDAFRSGTLRAVCATSLADEGLDIRRLDRLVLAAPARAEGHSLQRLGRLMRPDPGKAPPVLFDLVDDHPAARRQHLARCRAYRKELGAGVVQQAVPFETAGAAA